MDVQAKIREYRALMDQKDELNTELKDINQSLDVLNKELAEYFQDHEMQSMNVMGVGTVYLEVAIHPNIEEPELTKDWLTKRGDLEMLLTFNTNKFKAYYKSLLEAKEELPPGVTQFTDTKIKIRRT